MSANSDARVSRLPAWAHRQVSWSAVGRFVLVVAIAAVGAFLGLVVAGTRTENVGPLVVRVTVAPSLDGDTVVDVPPLGTISVDSHDGPLRVRATVEGIDSDATQGFLDGQANIGTRDEIVSEVRSMLAWTYAQAVVVMVLGASLLVLVVYRRPRRAVVVGVTTLALVLAAGAVGVATWNDRALVQPKYTGLLVYAPRVVGSAGSVLENFEQYGDQLARLVGNVSRLSATLTSLPTFEPDPNTIRVLHVSDIHLNPNVWPIMRTIIKQYEIDVVVDTGDIADHGTSAETGFVLPIGTLGVPYVYVRGNHDSRVTEAAVARQPNAVTLDGTEAEVGGLTFLGSGDPRFTPDKETISSPEEVVEQGETLAAKASALPAEPDVILVHDPGAAPSLNDAGPLVLAGHIHQRRAERLDDDTELLVQGSTGGAGLRALESEDPTPLTFTVLYFDRETKQLQARDEITLGGLGTSSAEVTRILTPTESRGSAR